MIRFAMLPEKVAMARVRMTNADIIRHMTDEELARWIDEFWSAAWCPDDPPVDPETKGCLMHDGNCELCILDWLKKEVEE